MITLNTSAGEFQIGFKFDQTDDNVRTTECTIFKSGEKVGYDITFCNPKDNFSRVEGRKKAFDRAVWGLTHASSGGVNSSWKQNIEDGRQLRIELWNAYFALPMKTR